MFGLTEVEQKLIREIHDDLHCICHQLRRIAEAIEGRQPQPVSSLQVLFDGANMPASLKPGQSVSATFNELGPDGKTVVTPPLPFDAPPSWSSDNTSIATATAAADGLSAVIAYVGPGVANLTVTGTIAGNKVTGTDFVTDAALPPAVSGLQIVFGTPTP